MAVDAPVREGEPRNCRHSVAGTCAERDAAVIATTKAENFATPYWFAIANSWLRLFMKIVPLAGTTVE